MAVPPFPGGQRVLLIACGALAREVLAPLRGNSWSHVDVQCLPAELHNRPERIPEAVRGKIRAARGLYENILVVYGDCGTSGALDALLAEEGVERIAGPHCYAFYAGQADFEACQEEEPGTFYLTDFLVRHFQRLVIQGLGLDRHPDLLPLYFGNYSRLVYLAQTDDPALRGHAMAAADRLNLKFECRTTGLGELGAFVASAARRVA